MIPDSIDPAVVPVPLNVLGSGEIQVDSLLETLTTPQKVGQLLMPWLLGNYAANESEQFDTLGVWLDSLGIGGIVISIGPPFEIAAKLNTLQRRSALPLLIASDLEWGSAMRVRGGTAFPMPMGVAATGRDQDAYEMGRITAIEARALGIHWTFAPVADVNNNPNNAIINTRSFGEDPTSVARLVIEFIRGASDHGLLTTAKHFPGHGDTETDSHISVPLVTGCWDRLDSLELVPFRAAIDAGVTAVMTSHIALPCLDGDDPLPATLSPGIMTGLLRDSLDYGGLLVTDALDMGAIVSRFGAGESAIRAFLAGADLLLMPAHLLEVRDAMVDAVVTGRIPLPRLNDSVRRILDLKVRTGLFTRRDVALENIPASVGKREFMDFADDVAARSLTLVQRGSIDELRRERGRTALIVYANESNLSAGGQLARELRNLGETVGVFRLYPSSGTLSYDSARTLIDERSRTVFAVNVRVVSGLGHIAMPDSLAALITETDEARATVLVSFGNPYLLRQVPEFAGTYINAWSDIGGTERAAARALAGGAAVSGRLPISIDDRFARGFGISIASTALDDEVGGSGAGAQGSFDSVGKYLEAQVEAGAFPGAVLGVSYGGADAYQTAVGHYGVDDARPVGVSTIYDLASLTKVIGLTTAVMLLVADGSLDIDRPVVHYLPHFGHDGKAEVTVRQLLLHSSGLPAWRPLYQEAESPEAARDSVFATGLDTVPGTTYVYSDLGAITLAEVVEAISGQPLDAFLHEHVFEPLQMTSTRFNPPESWRRRIAPTEMDPWRGRIVRGEVHDENAARLGGVSGHAGLFSTVPDLLRFARWLVDSYHGRLTAAPMLPANVVREFIRRQNDPPGSTRALGWDTPSVVGRSSAGRLLSRQSYGHTGFTGTSIWTDPDGEIVIVLLTNRVHPTRDNVEISRVRGEVADLVIQALRKP